MIGFTEEELKEILKNQEISLKEQEKNNTNNERKL